MNRAGSINGKALILSEWRSFFAIAGIGFLNRGHNCWNYEHCNKRRANHEIEHLGILLVMSEFTWPVTFETCAMSDK